MANVVDKGIGDTDMSNLNMLQRKLEFKEMRKLPRCAKYEVALVQTENNISSSMITADGGLLVTKYDQIIRGEQFCVDRNREGDLVAVFCDGCGGKVSNFT